MSLFLRAAAPADQAAIVAIIRQAHINPTGLHWQRFVVVQSRERLIGTGQIKLHPDGTRELASIAVVPEHQGQGIGGVIIRALLRRSGGPLYLITVSKNEGFYRRFGFVPAPAAALPVSLARVLRGGRLYVGLRSLLQGAPVRLIAMRHSGVGS